MTENTRKSNENDENVPDEAVTGEEQKDLEGQNLDNGSEEASVEAPVEDQELDRDDLLADVRQSLISSDDIEEKRVGFFQKLTGRFKKSSESASVEIEKIDVVPPESPAPDDMQLELEEEESKASTRISRKQREQIESFFSELEALTADVDYELLDSYVPEKKVPESLDEVAEQEVEQETEQIEEPFEEPLTESVGVEDEVPQVSTIKDISVTPEEGGESEIDLRELALQDYDETVIEPASEVKLSVGEVVRTTVRDFKPAERILWGFVFVVTVVMMLSAGVYFLSPVLMPAPEPTVTPVPSDIPYPVRVVLPGDWRIDLHKGRVVDGTWDPQGAEWLEGTEISRWVALPWSEQIGAVVRTFTKGDQIGLVMSNYDILTYQVDSIVDDLSFEGLQSLDTRTPNLLLIVPRGDIESDNLFYVVTALP